MRLLWHERRGKDLRETADLFHWFETVVFIRLLFLFYGGVDICLFVLWMLPGIAVFLFSVIPLMRANPGNSGELSSAVEVSFHLVSVGMIAMVVLGVMGYLYYAMAEFILADEPEERVLSCARRSKTLMKGRRGVLMSLWLSFLLWYQLLQRGCPSR